MTFGEWWPNVGLQLVKVALNENLNLLRELSLAAFRAGEASERTRAVKAHKKEKK